MIGRVSRPCTHITIADVALPELALVEVGPPPNLFPVLAQRSMSVTVLGQTPLTGARPSEGPSERGSR